MTTYVPAKKSTEYIFYISLVSQSTGQFQSNPTLASGDFKISKDGGALANLTTLPAVTPASSKAVKVTLSSTEMGADNVVVIGSDAAGAEWDDVFVNIQTAVQQIDDLATAAALATVQADTDNIQTRLPAALSGDGFMKADLLSIGDELVSGNNATLALKKLDVQNSAGNAVIMRSTGGAGAAGVVIAGSPVGGNGMEITSSDSDGIYLSGAAYGLDVSCTASGSVGVSINGDAYGLEINSATDHAVNMLSLGGNGHGINITGGGTGKSINAPQDINVSDGELTLAAIASAVWANATRTLTAISDSAGVTTLLSRIGAALNISSGKVESNVKQVNDTDITGDGSTTPWGPE